MNVPLNPDQEAQLQQIAAQNGQNADDLALSVFERFLAYETAEVEALEQGIAQADRGELIDHAAVVAHFTKN